MADLQKLEQDIFRIDNEDEFNRAALEVFRFQYDHNGVYRRFCDALGKKPSPSGSYQDIPFMPIEFFKQHKILSVAHTPDLVFSSSGTTGMQTSSHYVHKPALYIRSFMESFRMFMGEPSDYHILALLPGYLERQGSSLIYMVNHLIEESRSNHSGFYLHDVEGLVQKVKALHDDPRKVLLLGVSFALMDMADRYRVEHPRLLVMETGGMKGRRKEMIRSELHQALCQAFGVKRICSEYGMTELLSQAWSLGDGVFVCPPWMRVLARDVNDPLSRAARGASGGLSVIDLANLYSCSFIATQDLMKELPGQSFEVLGRFDSSDIRGCNLMIA